MATRIALVLSLLAPAVVAAQVTSSQGGIPPIPTPPGSLEPATPAHGAISGTVVDGVTGEAVPGAVAFLGVRNLSKPILAPQLRQVTDERGRFVFANLPGDSTYTVAGAKIGYLDGGYGRDSSPTDPLRHIALKGEAWVPNIRVAIWKPGSVAGIVRDEAGEPVVGVFVRALMRVRILGRDDIIAGPLTLSDDRGAYRIGGLAPGRYLIQVPSVQASIPSATTIATGSGNLPDGLIETDDTHRLVVGKYPLPPPAINGRQMAYPAAFHPATPVVADATAIDLKYGDERDGVNITLTPVPSVRVSGIVEAPADAMRSLTLRLLPTGLENVGLGSEAATAFVGPDGRFTFINVPAGSYTLDAPVTISELSSSVPPISLFNRPMRFPVPPPGQGSSSNSDTIELIPGVTLANSSYRGQGAAYSARVPLVVGGADVANVVVRLRQHGTMSGRIVVESDPAQPGVKPPSRFTPRLDSANGEAYLGRPQNQTNLGELPPDQFFIPDIIPGQYYVRVQGYPAWQVKSVSWRGREYLTTSFDTTAGEEISGVVITMTNATPTLTGTVRGLDDLKAEPPIVVAFPVENAQWRSTGFYPGRMKVAAVSATGLYQFTTLPAGDYYVAAINRSFTATWRDPAFLAKVAPLASRVALTWSGKTGQDLTPVVVR